MRGGGALNGLSAGIALGAAALVLAVIILRELFASAGHAKQHLALAANDSPAVNGTTARVDALESENASGVYGLVA